MTAKGLIGERTVSLGLLDLAALRPRFSPTTTLQVKLPQKSGLTVETVSTVTR